MDSHFSVLGIARGTTEADMRKAYKSKALQYHPDRNPNGVEVFKKINAAYEELTKHYKKNGGVDKRSILEQSDAGIPRGFSGRNWKSSAASGSTASSTPLFTEEELFGRMPNDNFGIFSGGGGTSTRQSYGGTTGKGFRQSRQPPPPSSSAQNDATNEAWRNAHGGRNPESAYNAFRSEAETSAFQSQMKHFEEMEKMKRAMGGGDGAPTSSTNTNTDGRRASDENQPRFGRRSPQKMDSSGNEANKDSATSSTSRPLPRQGSASSLFRAKKEHDTMPSFNASQNNIHSQRELESTWATERETQARLKRAQEAMEETDRRLRKEQREAETREEWERTQAEMDLERKKWVADERMAELDASLPNGPQHCVDDSIRQIALDRRKEKVHAMSRLLPTKPLLDKMSIPELYILRELVNEFQSGIFSSVESRIRAQSTCLVCHATKKDLRTKDMFKCEHFSICFQCSFTCALCPICGADRADM